jgi:hypothetical protein
MISFDSSHFALFRSSSYSHILENARATLGIPADLIVRALNLQGYPMTLQEYFQYERDPSRAQNMPASLWVHLCKALFLVTEVFYLGYDYKAHLQRIQEAIEEKTYSLPISSHLQCQLGLLRDLFRAQATHVFTDKAKA